MTNGLQYRIGVTPGRQTGGRVSDSTRSAWSDSTDNSSESRHPAPFACVPTVGPLLFPALSRINSLSRTTTCEVSPGPVLLLHRWRKEAREFRSFAGRWDRRAADMGLRELATEPGLQCWAHSLLLPPTKLPVLHLFLSDTRSRSSFLIMTHVCCISFQDCFQQSPCPSCQDFLSGFFLSYFVILCYYFCFLVSEGCWNC